MSFQVRPTEIPAVKEVLGRRFTDPRGSFQELYRHVELSEALQGFTPIQQNVADSDAPGAVRGLHFQRPPHAQAKLVQVVRGAVYDVAVDLRAEAGSYGRWVARTLSADADPPVQLFVPAGFAHGYLTLEPHTVVVYLLDAYYAPDAESGVHWRSPDLAIPWPPRDGYVVSEKDRSLPDFADVEPVEGI